MTDSEIIENLKQEIRLAEYTDSTYCDGVSKELLTSALNLINRQESVIKRLRRDNRVLSRNADNAFQEGLNECRSLFELEIKPEAYKEFAERLKNKWFDEHYDSPDVDFDDFIDNLLEEMVGEE